MYVFLIVVFVIVCLALIGLILLQRGKGSQTGLTYDPQSSVFGASGSVNFLVKLTAILAVSFFILGILISINFRESILQPQRSLIEQASEAEEQRLRENDALPQEVDVPRADFDFDGEDTQPTIDFEPNLPDIDVDAGESTEEIESK